MPNKSQYDIFPRTYRPKRNFTDVFFTLLFWLYVAGVAVIASICVSYGSPTDLWYGVDYLGYHCGQGQNPKGFTSHIETNQYQSKNWTENTLLWIPLEGDHTRRSRASVSPSEAIYLYGAKSAGVCVKKCPRVDDPFDAEVNSVKGLVNTVATYADYFINLLDSEGNSKSANTANRVSTYGDYLINGTRSKFRRPASYEINYNSKPLYGRCIPISISSTVESRRDRPYSVAFVEHFFSGIVEVIRSWKVITVSIAISAAFCIIYIQVLSKLTQTIIYMSILGAIGGATVIGLLLYFESTADQSEIGTFDPKFYFAFALVSWIIAVMGLILFYWFRKNIDQACALIQLSGRVVKANLVLFCIPMASFLMLAGMISLFVCLAVLSFSMEENVLSEAAHWHAQLAVTSIGYEKIQWDMGDLNLIRAIGIYLIFGLLWCMEILSAYCFMVLSFCYVFLYFRERRDDPTGARPSGNSLPDGSLRRAIKWTTFYHFGTLVIGSLIVTIIQSLQLLLRVIMFQASRVLQKSEINRFLFYVSDLIVTISKKILSFGTKNGYILTCITSKSFCPSTKEAFHILSEHFVTLIFLQFLKEVTLFIGKLLVVCGTLLCSTALFNTGLVSDGVSRFYPQVVIALLSYFISSNFFYLLSVSLHTTLLCFAYDSYYNSGFYTPEELSKFLRTSGNLGVDKKETEGLVKV
ncbi:choline transporter-like protein 3 [Perkinsela sp. CCAP 1560/4]|nr:choline transporter-like protein 3 [Perkinsela sp. CCAP 1560/4]|eukprot:KNH09502.1 choline transporter-like protein 3 [Perkinsela sp. CCAP 1560/4]